MLTPSSSGPTGSVDVGPQPISNNGGSPISFAHGWGTGNQENIPPRHPGSVVGGLVLIQEDGGEIDQGMRRVMEDNHVNPCVGSGPNFQKLLEPFCKNLSGCGRCHRTLHHRAYYSILFVSPNHLVASLSFCQVKFPTKRATT
jgi:hypothetical protein